MRDQTPAANLIDSLKSAARSTGLWSTVAGVVGAIAVGGGGILYLSIDEIQDFSIAVLIIGAVLLGIAVALSPRAVGMFLTGRQGRYGANALAMTVAFFAFVILINYVVSVLIPARHLRHDVTATRFLTLAPQTVQILKNLETDIRANAFFLPNDIRSGQAEDLLNEFSRQSDKFNFRFEDPELNRSLAIKYGVQQYPAIVIEDRDTGIIQAITAPTEQQIATGILVVTGVKQKKVYILTGHKERSTSRDLVTGELDSEGFDLAVEGLLRDNYAVQALNLQQIPRVPADAAVVVIAGPRQDLDQQEFEALDSYVRNSGRVIALFDPDTDQAFVDLVAQWGILLGKDAIVDVASAVAGKPLTPLIQRANGQYVSSKATGVDITNQIDVTFYPGVTSVEAALPQDEMPPQIRFLPLAMTTPASWLERDVENISPNPDVDRPGPFPVASVVEACATIDAAPVACINPEETTKLVVFGDSDFIKNQFFSSRDNADIFLNSVNYLTDDFDLISIRPKFAPIRELVVTTRERDFIQWSSWLLPPALMVMIGLFVWWRRR